MSKLILVQNHRIEVIDTKNILTPIYIASAIELFLGVAPESCEYCNGPYFQDSHLCKCSAYIRKYADDILKKLKTQEKTEKLVDEDQLVKAVLTLPCYGEGKAKILTKKELKNLLDQLEEEELSTVG